MSDELTVQQEINFLRDFSDDLNTLMNEFDYISKRMSQKTIRRINMIGNLEYIDSTYEAFRSLADQLYHESESGR